MEYNSREVLVSFGGVEMTGFGEDTMVSWEYDTEFTTDKVGVGGVVTASKTNDRRATVTFTLMETSPSNAILATFAKARFLGTGAIGNTTLHISNTLTGEEITAAEAWILNEPSGEFGSEASEREWEVRCAKLIYNHAGLQA